MKKTLLLLFFTLLGAVQSFADPVKIGDIFYNFKDTEAVVVSGSYSGEVVIPETVEYNGSVYTVTEIGNEAFYGCSGLTSVTIPNSVTEIGYSVFLHCSGLESVNISCKDEADFANYIKRSDIYSVFHADDLSGRTHRILIAGEEQTEIVIPNSITLIGSFAFTDCSGLTSVAIPNSVTEIGWRAFAGCSGLTSVNISCEDETDFADYIQRSDIYSVFHTDDLLGKTHRILIAGEEQTEIVIPNSVTSIGNFVLYKCSNLNSVTFPSSVTEIRDGAFYGCSGLTSISIPESVTEIGSWAFSGCSGLRDVFSLGTIPPICGLNVFENVKVANCWLHVPVGTREDYAIADTWSAFFNIMEDAEPSGVSMLEMGNGDAEYYMSNGVKVSEPTTPGIYIVKKNVETKTIVVKK